MPPSVQPRTPKGNGFDTVGADLPEFSLSWTRTCRAAHSAPLSPSLPFLPSADWVAQVIISTYRNIVVRHAYCRTTAPSTTPTFYRWWSGPCMDYGKGYINVAVGQRVGHFSCTSVVSIIDTSFTYFYSHVFWAHTQLNNWCLRLRFTDFWGHSLTSVRNIWS